MSLLRKCIAIFFLLLVLSPLTGFVLFHHQQKQIRISIKKDFKAKELSTVHIRQLRWYKKNKEIIIHGTLFDVSSIRKEADGTYTVTGLYDHQEQQLHALMDKATRKNKGASSLLSFSSCFISDQTDWPFQPLDCSFLLSTCYPTDIVSWKPQFQPDLLTPPPQEILFSELFS
ncbi:hypothetical protein KACHI17_24000 [Sediminibacterium sp. KACHI17]|uniref:DUF4131 domain-containing protein n=1 Tax=Sediminibacterium sp. KACHI17 TaxID=1751071 RepID=A0AAT9GLF2_9BACT